MKQPNSKNFVPDIFNEIAIEIGATILIEKKYGYAGLLNFANGKQLYFRSDRFNINKPGSIEISTDKNYSHYFLKHFGYSVPLGKVFFSPSLNDNIKRTQSIHDGYAYAKKLGFPIIIKPNNSSKGRLVSKVFNKTQYYKDAKVIMQQCHVMLVEKFYKENDYRIIVFKDTVFAAYQRYPLVITGDGKTTIHNLINLKKAELKSGGIATIKSSDYRIKANIKRLGFNYNTVLFAGHSVQLLDNANVSSGGTIIDLTTQTHPSYKTLAINIARDMDLQLCGIDLIAADISSPVSKYVILEINSAPALSHYASLGVTHLEKTKHLYLDILKMLERS